MGFAAATGIDARLFYFVPLSTLFTVLTFLLVVSIVGDVGPRAALGAGSVFVPFALALMPLTLPPALTCWVLARLVFWRAGFGEQRAALFSGVLSGLAAVTIPALLSSSGGRALLGALSGALVFGLAAGLSGGLAAVIVYWDGWKRLKSGGA